MKADLSDADLATLLQQAFGPVVGFDWAMLAARALSIFGALYHRAATPTEQAWIVDAAQEYGANSPTAAMPSDDQIVAGLVAHFGPGVSAPAASTGPAGGTLTDADVVASALSGALGRPATPEEVETGLYILHQFRAILGRDPTPGEGQDMLARLVEYIGRTGHPPSHAEIDAYLQSVLGGASAPVAVPGSCAPAGTGAAQLPVFDACTTCPPGYVYQAIAAAPATGPPRVLECNPPAAPTLSSDMSWRQVDPIACTWQRIRSGGVLVPGVFDGVRAIIYPETPPTTIALNGPRRFTPGRRRLGAEAPVQTGWCLQVSDPLAVAATPAAAVPTPSLLPAALGPFGLVAGGGGSGIGGFIAAHPYLSLGGGVAAVAVLASAFGGKKKAR